MTFIPSQNESLISTLNSTNAPLAASAVFTGIGEDVSGFASISAHVFSNVDSATLGAKGQFSTNNVDWDDSIPVTITGNDLRQFVVPVTAQYFRVVYTNGLIAQAVFRLQIIYHNSKNFDVGPRLNTRVVEQSRALVGRSAIMGQFGNTDFANVPVNNSGALFMTLVEPRTSFDEVSVGQRTPVIQLDFSYAINTKIVTPTTTGIGTVTQSESQAVLTTGASAASSARIVSRARVRLRPGQETDAPINAIFTQGAANSIQIVGVGTDTNGVFFGYNGASFGVLRRSNGVDTWTAQTSWNTDKMDGTGPSGMVLNPTNGNVYKIDVKSGYGGVAYYILDQLTDRFLLVHIDVYANLFTEPNIRLAILPVLLLAENFANTTSLITKISNAGYFVEGVPELIGPKFVAENDKTGVGTTLTNILTIRNKTTYAAQTNLIQVKLSALSVAVDGNKPAVAQLVFNGTLGGTPVFNDIDTQNSVVEVDTAGTTVTGGQASGTLALAAVDGFNGTLDFLSVTLNPGDQVTLAARATQTNTDVLGSLSWQEDI